MQLYIDVVNFCDPAELYMFALMLQESRRITPADIATSLESTLEDRAYSSAARRALEALRWGSRPAAALSILLLSKATDAKPSVHS